MTALSGNSPSPRNGVITSEAEQMDRFRTYVRSLNEQFARWVVQQWETKSDRRAHLLLNADRHVQ